MRTPSRSRGRSPEVCERAEGARAPKRCDLFLVRQPCHGEAMLRTDARVRWSAVPRVQHRLNGPSVPPGGFKAPGYRRSGPLAAALLDHLSRAAAEGRPCVPLLGAPGLDRRPRNLRRAILTTTLRTESNAASTGHRPLPRFRRSAAASLVSGKDAGRVWGRRRRRGLVSAACCSLAPLPLLTFSQPRSGGHATDTKCTACRLA